VDRLRQPDLAPKRSKLIKFVQTAAADPLNALSQNAEVAQ
jgi:hypothetical protein